MRATVQVGDWKAEGWSTISEIRCPNRIRHIVHTLFLDRPSLQYEVEGIPDEVPVFVVGELERAIGRLPSRKAPGPNNIPNEVLRVVYDITPQSLLHPYNTCLQSGVFPKDWKRGRLVLLQKGDTPLSEPNSYRALTMLNTIGKVLERLLLNRIENWIEEKGGLSPRQFGFQRGRGTIEAVGILMGKIREALATRIRNVLNMARWDKILNALIAKRAPRYIVRMVRDYLRDRVITYETEKGLEEHRLRCGIPQGSVLGPTL